MTTHQHPQSPHHHHGHDHGQGHLDEAHWEAWAEQAEREGDLLLAFVTEAAAWVSELRGLGAPPVTSVIDVGSGPGVGTCELARRFGGAQVVAVDSSPAMLERARRRVAEAGLAERVGTHLAELPDGLDGLDGIGPADVIWASMSLHHVGDEVLALRALGDLLAPGGLLAVAERADPMRVLPERLDVGRPGLLQRFEEASADWYAQMRDDLPGSVPSGQLETMFEAAGYEVLGSRVARLELGPPLADEARRAVLGHLQRIRDHLAESLDEDDLDALDVLIDGDDRRSVLHRDDVFVAASRQIVVARRAGA